CGHSASHADVPATRCFARTLQRRLDPVRDEVKDGPAFHLQRRSRVVRQYEGGRVIRRALTPPTSPGLVGPWAPDRAEHIAAEYPSSDTLHAPSREVLVDAGVPTFAAVRALEGASAHQPVMQAFTA